jgi:hypothetical protein
MKSTVVTFCLLLVSIVAHAQMPADTIEIKKNQYRKQGVLLGEKQMMQIMSNNPEALKEMAIAKKKARAARVFSGIGGGLIGYSIGVAIGGGKANWNPAAIGAGIVLAAGIPLSVSYNRHTRAAVNIYNKDIKQGKITRLQFKFGLSPTAAALRITF